MYSKFFTTAIKPTIAASIQHIGAFTSGDLLFDWTSFQIPKGGAKLVNLTVLVRPKGDGGPTPNDNSITFLFSSSDTVSLGTAHGTVDNRPSNDFLGVVEISSNHYSQTTHNSTSIGTMGVGSSGTANLPMTPLVLEGDGTSAYDTLYIAGVAADGSMNFESLNAIAEDTDAEHANSQVITTDGSGMDVREHFMDGDVVHIGTSEGTPAADSLIGTIASADGASQVTLDAVSPTALVDGDILYNINPIRIILQFER